ncbi:MAG TPA: hypothetical protein VKO43_03425, partial [Candidatus Krumholzibacteriaceae bacterium]|nr:hypothetical protein [Candidatus Krumholzibacteriaceae bacterium]
MKRSFSIFIVTAVLLFMFVSCFEDESSPTSPDRDTSINVNITSPASGDTFLVDSTIVFTGSASDPEDGMLNDSSLVWRVNTFPQDTLGFGDTVKTNTLPEGRHTIILTATDSEGNSNYDYIFLYVTKLVLNPSLENIWPNKDGTKWKYQYTQRFFDSEDPLIFYPTEDDVPEIPSLSYIEDILGTQPIGNINNQNLGVYKLEFAADT